MKSKARKSKGPPSSHPLQADDTGAGMFTDIMANFPDIIHSVDEKGTIVSINKKGSDLLGYAHEELIGRNVFVIYADEIVADARRGFEELKRRGVIERIETKLKTKYGEVIDVEMRSMSVYDAEGTFVKTFTITRDIRPLNSLKAQLVQQSKLAAIGELASGIMHDIRDPLSLIKAYNEDVLPEALAKGDSARIEKCQKAIAKGTQKILRLSEHLRTFSRQDDSNPERILVNELIADALLIIENRVGTSGATIVNRGQSKELVLFGKTNQLEQVLINIIGNACDAVKDQANKEIVVDVDCDGDTLVIRIEDFGPGIHDEDKARIFDAFFTTKPKGQGTGLGLSICAAIVKDHGGELTFSSVLGKGTAFFVRLPKTA